MYGLAVYVKEGLPFSRDLSLETVDSYLCFELALLHSVSYFFFLYWSPSSSSTVFDSISSNIDEVLSINPSPNVFVFEDFIVHHKDRLIYSGGTDRFVELCYNFVIISNGLTQMVNFPTRILACGSHSPALLDLFISSGASICSTMSFPSLGNCDHVLVLVSIDFPINSKRDAPFHCIAYDYSCADWDGLCDHLTQCFCCCLWMLWMGSGWNWCICYSS